MEMEFKTAVLLYYKEFTYGGGNLTATNVWTTPAKLTKLFNKTFAYGGGKLTTTVLTRISDAATLTCTYAYTGVNVTSITRT
jgi:hypothetical protein